MLKFLETDIKFLPGVGPMRKELLRGEVGIESFADLLEYYPYKYVDRSRFYLISELTTEMPFVQIRGHILSFDSFDTGRKTRVVAHFYDGHQVMDLVWFNQLKWVTKHYTVGTEYIVFGKPLIYGRRFQIVHPEIESVADVERQDEQLGGRRLQPYYGTTEKMKKAGVTSRTIERWVKTLLMRLKETVPETMPLEMVARLNMMSRDDALRNIHYPHSPRYLEQARQRLKFEELFFLQLDIVRYMSDNRRKYSGYRFQHVGDLFNQFYYYNLPFSLTNAQKRVLREIRRDMDSDHQMNRLLQGDVGSGKTLVALMSMLIAIDNGYQACIMAPTEILAEQHMLTLNQFLRGMPVSVELLTGVVQGKRRREVMEGLSAGSVNILVGTHAIIEDPVVFHNLGLAVVDEQHRFGVAQRAKLWKKNDKPPHVLVMTATPIPRTLAMTIYGDLDVSVIDEMPPGRKPVITLHKYDTNTTSLYDGIRRQINEGRQVYWVFPLIEESEKTDLKNLEDGYDRLCRVFCGYKLGKVHGRMKDSEKNAEMQRFAKGETQILVATTVIEVGVNVPNASVMVIMDAQRFGLSQLHQLRGRVGRGADQSFCILVTNYKLSEITKKRIEIMCATNDGFRIAEADLKLRGPGDLQGTQQSGIAFNLRIADITRDGQLVKLAREEAQRVIAADPLCESDNYSVLWQRLKEIRKSNVDWSAIS